MFHVGLTAAAACRSCQKLARGRPVSRCRPTTGRPRTSARDLGGGKGCGTAAKRSQRRKLRSCLQLLLAPSSAGDPDELVTAWELATDEQRATAVERERRREERDAELLEDYSAGKIDAATYEAQVLAEL